MHSPSINAGLLAASSPVLSSPFEGRGGNNAYGSDGSVLKPFENLAEAHTMQFVAQHTSIPVPKVHYAFVHNGSTYIVMSKIEGTTLWQGWTTRSGESKRRILDQVKPMLAELRALTASEGTGVANVNGGPICDCLATLHSGHSLL